MRMAGFELKTYNLLINENKENIDNNDVSRLRQHLQQNNGEELAEEEINYSTNLSSTSLSDNELIVTEEQENDNKTPSLEGNRLVDIGYLFSQLATMSHHPFDCNFTSMNFMKEKRIDRKDITFSRNQPKRLLV
ncbi:unnamed protein product [Parnassius apollo]|uniref:(apollo) hypothetical protein n=1 Tax=Parnassius apollo TaxID=110799 RepID=A0A8S3WQ19_PARAO|nr:unnamed protein product [Parnassius apollo]